MTRNTVDRQRVSYTTHVTNDEILTPLQVSANMLHEAYRSFLAAGFTNDEALKIVIGLVGQSNTEDTDGR